MCSEVVGHVIGVATWQRCTYGAYLWKRMRRTALICAHVAELPAVCASSSRTNTGFVLYLLDRALGKKHSTDSCQGPFAALVFLKSSVKLLAPVVNQTHLIVLTATEN